MVYGLLPLEEHTVDCPTSPSEGAAPTFWQNDSKLEDDFPVAIPHILTVLTEARVLDDVQRCSQERLEAAEILQSGRHISGCWSRVLSTLYWVTCTG